MTELSQASSYPHMLDLPLGGSPMVMSDAQQQQMSPTPPPSAEASRNPSARKRDRHGAELASFQRDRFPQSSRDTRYPDFLEKLLDEFENAQHVVGRGGEVQFSKDKLQEARGKLAAATGTKGWRIWLKEPLFNRFRDLKQSSSPADTTHSEFVELLLDLHDLVEANNWDSIRRALTGVPTSAFDLALASGSSLAAAAAAGLTAGQMQPAMLPMLFDQPAPSAGAYYVTPGGQPMTVGSTLSAQSQGALGSWNHPNLPVVGMAPLNDFGTRGPIQGLPAEFSNLEDVSLEGVVKRSLTSPGNSGRARGIPRTPQLTADLNRTKSLTNSNKKTRDGATVPPARRPSLRSLSGHDSSIIPSTFLGHRRTASALSTSSIRSTSSAAKSFYTADSPILRPVADPLKWPLDSDLLMQGIEGINLGEAAAAGAYLEHQQHQQRFHQQQQFARDMHSTQASAGIYPPAGSIMGFNPRFGSVNPFSNNPLLMNHIKTEPEQQQEAMFEYTTLGVVAEPTSYVLSSPDAMDTTFAKVDVIPSTELPATLDSMYDALCTSMTGSSDPFAAQQGHLSAFPAQDIQVQIQQQIQQQQQRQHQIHQRQRSQHDILKQHMQQQQEQEQAHHQQVQQQQQHMQQQIHHQQQQAQHQEQMHMQQQQQQHARHEMQQQVQMQFQHQAQQHIHQQAQQMQLEQTQQIAEMQGQQATDAGLAMAMGYPGAFEMPVTRQQYPQRQGSLPGVGYELGPSPSPQLQPLQPPPRMQSMSTALPLYHSFDASGPTTLYASPAPETPPSSIQQLQQPAPPTGLPDVVVPSNAGIVDNSPRQQQIARSSPPTPSIPIPPPPSPAVPVAAAATASPSSSTSHGWRFRNNGGGNVALPQIQTAVPANGSTAATAAGPSSPSPLPSPSSSGGGRKRLSKIINRLSFIKGSSSSNNASSSSSPQMSPPIVVHSPQPVPGNMYSPRE
ncbi:hypothetical protein HKX48_003185 [Thoreauomyces humboldtii]|nr:hypothetical protein HKX48_003185 [Thoreauomyces humboldtii]